MSIDPDAPMFSVVAPVYDEEGTIDLFYDELTRVMECVGAPYELVLVDDGSTDGSPQVMEQIVARDPRVRLLRFARNFGHQAAISAGIDYARGRAVIIIDSDLQDPPDVIPRLIQAWQNGAEVVYAQRTHRAGESAFKVLTASVFYRLIRRIAKVDIPKDTGDFRLLDRQVVNQLKLMKEHNRFMRGLSAWVGFRQEAVPYERRERHAGTTKYPLRKMVRFSVDAITGFSYAPLQLATSLGFVLAGLSLLGIVVAAGLRIFTGAIVGQASTVTLVLLMGGIQMIFLGVIGEYLGRIYDEVRGRPLYIVREDRWEDRTALPGASDRDDSSTSESTVPERATPRS